jgi:gamma-D-glutamyl-L-lysine dipeptidyl-peptidase
MNAIEMLVRAFEEERGFDPRTTIFDVRVEQRDGALAVVGETTEPEAVEQLVERLAAEQGTAAIDDVLRLPDPALGTELHALVRAAVAPVHGTARVSSAQVSQYVLGHRLELLSRHDAWWRVRGEDGYIGWVHHGYLQTGDAEWAQAWERGEEGESMVSLGAELVDEAGRGIIRLPWGARVIRDAPRRFRLPDGRHGELGAGELVEVDRLVDWFPPRGESVTRTARRWSGTPYLWGGVTMAGADCSGFVQSVYWMHGVALPRDSDQQARLGTPIDVGPEFEELRAGDLLFFSERPERITHIAISLGGSRIIHSALSNGGVQENDLLGGREVERNLRSIFTCARRVLPD